MAKKKIILDLDTGIDDTLAISYVLGSADEAELIGITGTFGNVSVDLGVQNDLKILNMFGHDEIPVFRGIDHVSTSDEVYQPTWFEHALWHGHNGVGEMEIPGTPTHGVEDMSAMDFIADSVRKYGKDVVVVPTGSTTTIAATLKENPDIVDKIKIVTMGGTLTQPGNVNDFAEANASCDPEATNYMYSTEADITTIGLDVTMQALMTEADVETLRGVGTETAKFLAGMLDYYLRVSRENDPAYQGGCNLHDPLSAAVAIDPTLVKTFDICLKCDLEGPSRGRIIGDPSRLLQQPKHTHVALELDRERFKKQYMDRILALAAASK